MASTMDDPEGDGLLARLHELDVAAYQALTARSSPGVDRGLALISEAANLSKPWIAPAGVLALAGGPRGRRAALYGIASVTVASAVVNLAIKPLWPRRRPDRTEVPAGRHVPDPPRCPRSRLSPKRTSSCVPRSSARCSRCPFRAASLDPTQAR